MKIEQLKEIGQGRFVYGNVVGLTQEFKNTIDENWDSIIKVLEAAKRVTNKWDDEDRQDSLENALSELESK